MRISVICPVFNTPPEQLEAAARSVLAEPAELLAELILVDDASREPATLAALERLAAEPRVRVLRNAANTGPSVSRDRGVAVAAGDWIGLIDADDLWIAGRVTRVAAVVAAHPEARWIGSNYIDLFPDGSTGTQPSITGACPGERLDLDLVRLETPELTRRLVLNSWLAVGTIFIRKDLLAQVGGFGSGLYYHEDCLLWMKVSVLADLYFVEADTYVYRRGHASLMSSPARLSPEYARVHEVARAEPLLRGFARELRWARYAAFKGLALNNLLSGRRALALRFALQAWLADPREVADLALFARLFARRSREAILRDGARYSRAERFFLDAAQQGVRLP